jgi:signal transduction histidine kinase
MKRSLFIGIMAAVLLIACRTEAAEVNAKTDSLFNLLKSHNSQDTTRARLYHEYARSFMTARMDSAEKYYNLSLELSKNLGYDKGKMRALNGLGNILLISGNPREALSRFSESMKIGYKENDPDFLCIINNNMGVTYDKLGSLDSAEKYNKVALEYAQQIKSGKRQAKCLSDLATNATHRGDYEKAVQYNLKAKEFYESEHNTFDLTLVYIRLGVIYSEIKDFNKSIQSYRIALKFNDTLKNQRLRMTMVNNMGYLYYDIRKQYDTAKLLLNEALTLAQQFKSLEILVSARINLGNIAMEEQDYKKALEYFLVAYKLPQLAGMNRERTALEVNMGETYRKLGNPVLARKFLMLGLENAQKNGFMEFKKNAYLHLFDLETGLNHYKIANEYLVKYHDLKDSLWNQDIKTRIAELEFKSELNRKTALTEILQRNNELKEQVIKRQWILVAGIALVVVLLVVLVLVMLGSRNRIRTINRLLDEKNHKLEELNKTKDKFFSIVAHDLKSPFNALLGLLSELDESYDEFDEANRKKVIQSLRRNSNNTYNLLVNLLEWAQIQRTPLLNHPQETDLRQVVEQVMEVLQPRADMKQQALRNQVETGFKVFADPMLVKALLINLVNNSIKFTPVKGEIRVYASNAGGQTSVYVADNGIGIPEDKIPLLFRIDNSFKRQGTEQETGTGLGLIMCKEYIDMMGGEIKVQSRPGEGSTFCFSIPLIG